jgi:hypothetical protein
MHSALSAVNLNPKSPVWNITCVLYMNTVRLKFHFATGTNVSENLTAFCMDQMGLAICVLTHNTQGHIMAAVHWFVGMKLKTNICNPNILVDFYYGNNPDLQEHQISVALVAHWFAGGSYLMTDDSKWGAVLTYCLWKDVEYPALEEGQWDILDCLYGTLINSIWIGCYIFIVFLYRC